MFIGSRKGRPVYFCEVEDLPNFKSLAPEFQQLLTEDFAEKIEKYHKQKRYITILMQKKEHKKLH